MQPARYIAYHFIGKQGYSPIEDAGPPGDGAESLVKRTHPQIPYRGDLRRQYCIA